MRVWAGLLASAGILLGCFAAGRALDSSLAPVAPLDGTLTLTEEQKAEIWRTDPNNPANGPFPGAGPEFDENERAAINAVVRLAWAGALTTVASVERMSYREAMCGLATYPIPEGDVFAVWLKGPFQTPVFSIPYGVSAADFNKEFPSKLYLVDATSFVSQQSFAPWPLPRDPKANCPTR